MVVLLVLLERHRSACGEEDPQHGRANGARSAERRGVVALRVVDEIDGITFLKKDGGQNRDVLTDLPRSARRYQPVKS